MTRHATVKRKESIITHGIVLGIDNVKRLCAALGDPQNAYKTIHIAGTNGKGTTGLLLQSTLTESGFKTCRFSSPAVLERFETMQCDGIDITEREYIECMNEVLDAAEQNKIKTTDFECETAAAFLWFKQKNADFAIIECGMGGLLDATNVIDNPTMCVFTSIGLDHMKFLGNTKKEIAETKCGILRKCCVAVSAENSETRDIITKNCDKLNIPVLFVNKNEIHVTNDTIHGQTVAYKNHTVEINLSGTYQAENAALALECIDALKKFKNIKISDENIKSGFKSVKKYFGRFYPIHENPLVILDGAHNPNAADGLAKSVEKYLSGMKITAVFGAYKDKQYKTVAAKVLPFADKVFTVSTTGHRELTADRLADGISDICTATPCKSYLEALIAAVATECDCILVFGSLSYLHSIKAAADFLFSDEMKRFYNVIENPLFKNSIAKIYEKEHDRKFCRHGIDHLLYTAWIFEELLDEENIKLKKDFIYSIAFLHDLGRACNTENHDAKSAEFAIKIMTESGYSADEISLAEKIISNHSRKDDIENTEKISKAFTLADMYSRNCKTCFAYDECNWEKNKKEHTLKYISGVEKRLS